MAALAIRRATTADAQGIHALMQALAAHEGLTPYLAATPDSLMDALADQPPRAAFLLAEIDDRAVGFVSWTRVYGIWRGEDYLNLDDLFVVEAARGAGVGEALMRAFAAEADGLGARWEVRIVLTASGGPFRTWSRDAMRTAFRSEQGCRRVFR